jgi:soluble lytic murein transglycosylase-like protein
VAELVTRAEMEELARAAAEKYLLPPELVCAVIEQESAWRPTATRYEPAFAARYGQRYRQMFPECPYLDDAHFYSSLGLMQVMGAVAWEHQFRDDPQLMLDPTVNVEVGCRVLQSKLRACGWTPGNGLGEDVVVRGLLRWNGGGRKAYAREVLARVPKYRKEVQ